MMPTYVQDIESLLKLKDQLVKAGYVIIERDKRSFSAWKDGKLYKRVKVKD